MVPFLDNAKSRIPVEYHSLFDEAIGYYKIVFENLKKLSELFPFFGMAEDQQVANVKDKKLYQRAIESLTATREVEMGDFDTRSLLTLQYGHKNSA